MKISKEAMVATAWYSVGEKGEAEQEESSDKYKGEVVDQWGLRVHLQGYSSG